MTGVQTCALPILAGVALWLWAGRRGISDVQEPADENPEENASEDGEKESTGTVEESPQTVDEVGESPVEKDETPSQS